MEKWTFGEILRKRWNISNFILQQCLIAGLPAYERSEDRRVVFEDDPDDDVLQWADQFRYKISDVENFERDYRHIFDPSYKLQSLGNPDMDANEKRKFGQLKREKEKWDASIQAALLVGMFVQEQKQKNQVLKRKDVSDKLYKIDSSLPDTVFEKIWKAIPSQYRHKGGRTKNE
jgi:hypothetical protein